MSENYRIGDIYSVVEVIVPFGERLFKKGEELTVDFSDEFVQSQRRFVVNEICGIQKYDDGIIVTIKTNKLREE